MSKRRNKSYELYTWESTNPKKDTTSNISETMLLNPNFIELKDKQKVLYMYLKAQRFGKRKPIQDFKEVEAYRSEACFYFGLSDALKYGLYTEANKGRFYSDMKALEDAGFIRRISKGAKGRNRSIYMYADGWWTEEDRRKHFDRMKFNF